MSIKLLLMLQDIQSIHKEGLVRSCRITSAVHTLQSGTVVRQPLLSLAQSPHLTHAVKRLFGGLSCISRAVGGTQLMVKVLPTERGPM